MKEITESSRKLRQKFIEKVGIDRSDEFFDAIIDFEDKYEGIKSKAIAAMKNTISNCFGKTKLFTGNMVQVDYILSTAARKILKERKAGKQGKQEHDNAQKAQSIVFNKYKIFKFEDKFDKAVKDFKVQFQDVFAAVSGIDDILPNGEQFLEQVIESSNIDKKVSNDEVREFIKRYDKTYDDLFLKHKPKPEIDASVKMMMNKIRGNTDFAFDYDNKTGKLVGIPEIMIGELNEIQAAESALNYYIAYSEYFDNQKINLVLQLASFNHFVMSVCHPDLKDEYTRLLTLSEKYIAETVFEQYFNGLSPECFDDINTIKKKTLALESTRDLVVSMSAYMQICTKIFVDDFRENNNIDKNVPDNDIIEKIINCCPLKFQNYLMGRYQRLSNIVSITESNPLKVERLLKNSIDNPVTLLAKFISGEFENHAEMFKKYAECVQSGYQIVIPAGFDRGLIKLPNVAQYLRSFGNAVQKTKTSPILIERDDDIAQNVTDVIEKNFADTIGLESLKQTLLDQVCLLKILPSNSELRDLTFILTGNAGSGKTLSARKIHKVLFQTGILAKDEMYEDVAAALKAKFTGQTVEKVENIFTEHRGGTIFLDEAHSLFDNNQNGIDNFTNEAKSKFIKMVEKEKTRTAVIMAFYRDKLKDVLESEHGLYRRFAKRIDLPDYSPEQLFEMCQLKLVTDAKNTKTKPYIFSADAKNKLTDYFRFVVDAEKKAEKKENAGIVVRTLCGVLSKKAIRSSYDKEISVEDVDAYVQEDKETMSKFDKKNNSIGFGNSQQLQ